MYHNFNERKRSAVFVQHTGALLQFWLMNPLYGGADIAICTILKRVFLKM